MERKSKISSRKLRIWSHLLEKSLMENFIFCAVLNKQLWNIMYGVGFGLQTTNKFVAIVPKPHNIPQISLVLTL